MVTQWPASLLHLLDAVLESQIVQVLREHLEQPITPADGQRCPARRAFSRDGVVEGAALEGAAVEEAAVEGAAVEGAAVEGAAVEGAAVEEREGCGSALERRLDGWLLGVGLAALHVRALLASPVDEEEVVAAELQSEAIRGNQRPSAQWTKRTLLRRNCNQRPSEAIRAHQPSGRRGSCCGGTAIRGHQRPSEAIRGSQRPSEAIRSHRKTSDAIGAIGRNQEQSEATRGNQQHITRNRAQSEAMLA